MIPFVSYVLSLHVKHVSMHFSAIPSIEETLNPNSLSPKLACSSR